MSAQLQRLTSQMKRTYVSTKKKKIGMTKVGAISKAQKAPIMKIRTEICVGRFHEKLLFSDLRLLLTKTQYRSDITLKVRLYRLTSDTTRGNVNKIEERTF